VVSCWFVFAFLIVVALTLGAAPASAQVSGTVRVSVLDQVVVHHVRARRVVGDHRQGAAASRESASLT